jgi:hypothetical protein
MGTIKLSSTPIIYTPHCQADDKRLLAAIKYLYNLHLFENEFDQRATSAMLLPFNPYSFAILRIATQ